MAEHVSRRASAVRAAAVLLAAGLATAAVVAGPALTAGGPLTKPQAKKLFYTKKKADARFINVGEQATDSDRVDGLHAAKIHYESASGIPVEILNVAGLRITAECVPNPITRYSTSIDHASVAQTAVPAGGTLEDEDLGPSPGVFWSLPGDYLVELSFSAPGGRHVDVQYLQVQGAGGTSNCLVDGTALYSEG